MEATPSVDTTIITINKQGIMQSVDNNCCLMFGYTMNELVGKPVHTLIPAPYREQHDTYLANYHKTGNAKIIGRSRNVEGQHKDGTVFTIRLSVSEIKIPGSTIYVGMIDKLENTTATITADTNGIIVNCNENCKQVWGYELDELRGQNLSILMPSPYKESHDQFIANYHRTGKRNVIGTVRNVPAQHKDGHIFPICLQVQRIQIDGVTFFRGKVDRVNSENELVFTLDENGVVLSCNHNFVMPLMGYTAEELKDKHIRSILPALQYNKNETMLVSRVGKKRSSGYSLPTDMAKFSKFDEKMESVTYDMGEEPATPSEVSESHSDILKSWLGTSITNCRHRDDSYFRVAMTVANFSDPNGKNCFAIKVKRVIRDTSTNSLQSSNSAGSEVDSRFEPATTLGDGKYTVSSKTIGAGSFGRVYLGTVTETRKKVAIKSLQKDAMDAKELDRAMREIHILQKLRHPNICDLYDWYETEDTLYIVMEYVHGGELFGYIKSRTKLQESEARFFFKQILMAVEFCHLNNVIHRDLKDKNILLDASQQIKLIDFGLSNFTDGSLRNRTYCGTPAYSAPEMVLGTQYKGFEVDVWSLGVVLYSMVSGTLPFESISDITQGVFQPILGVSDSCKDLINRMLVVDPSKRPPISEILKHPFFIEEFRVAPDLDVTQVPEYQKVPLDMIVIENPDSFILPPK